MSKLIECQQNLLTLAQAKGYLTFDDILDAADASLLSLSDIDRLSDNLQSLGVLLYETEPEQQEEDADAYADYSRTDYGAIFSEITDLSDAISPMIELVKEILPPQFGEVQNLVEQLQYGNNYARERLVLSHLRIALKIALSVSKQYSYNIEDAVSASFIGLMEAVERFDPNGFSAFQSYASMWIQQNIHRYCTPVWMESYCPVHVKEKIYPVLLQYNHNTGTIITDAAFDPTIVDAIAEENELSFSQVERILRFAYMQLWGRIELDEILTLDESDDSKIQSLYDIYGIEDYTDSLADQVERKILREAIEALLTTFEPREQQIIRLRFGFDCDPQTLEEVGHKFDITKDRVRQIENKCIRQMRHPSRAKRIRDFCY